MNASRRNLLMFFEITVKNIPDLKDKVLIIKSLGNNSTRYVLFDMNYIPNWNKEFFNCHTCFRPSSKDFWDDTTTHYKFISLLIPTTSHVVETDSRFIFDEDIKFRMLLHEDLEQLSIKADYHCILSHKENIMKLLRITVILLNLS